MLRDLPSLSANAAPLQVGKYVLLERLGEGGMAEVWKARMVGPAGFSRDVVIKRVLPSLVIDPELVQLFVQEAQLAARMYHPNIVQVLELTEHEGEYMLAMEYLRGATLMSALNALVGRAIPPGFGALVVRDVCRGLGYVHARMSDDGTPLRIVHRDVSPANVMLGFEGTVKLVDFGIATALGESSDQKTPTGTLCGKFAYMSPEEVDGLEIDGRSDLFAAGVVLYETLTGRRLFKGNNELATLRRVRAAKVDPPSRWNAQVRPELDRICLKALARNPRDRYQAGEEMALDLDGVVHRYRWGEERLIAFLKALPTDTDGPFESLPTNRVAPRRFTPPRGIRRLNL
jgi:serine/threonine protein kinase